MDYQIREYTDCNMDEVLSLYASVGWTAYTDRPDMLERAFLGSREILGAYADEKLIGLIRAVGDGASILYIQDLLIYPEFQGKGIGTALLKELMTRNAQVYQKCLVTDDSEKSIAFYKKNGFILHEQYGCRGLIKIY